MKPLWQRILFNLSYFGLWVAYFAFVRIVFLIYYFDRTKQLDLWTIIQIPFRALRLDFSFSAYLAAVPFLIIAFSIWTHKTFTNFSIKSFTYPLLFIINFLMFFDIALYDTWGVRIDSTPLMYADTPKEMFASIDTWLLVFALSMWFASSWIMSILFNKVINYRLSTIEKGLSWNFPILLFFTALLVLVMRGGLQTIPINQSNVYFSDKMFANHAAVNFAWNFAHSLDHKTYDTTNPFLEIDPIKANKIIKEARDPLTKDSTELKLLNTKKPNVILIIWESLTAKIVEPLGGEPNVTEHFNRLSKEGILFENFYANGDRSDKGLIAILSGYLPQPHKSIIKMPNKTRTLPMLTNKMADLGYSTSFHHGGDLNFGNMNTYLRNGGISEFVDGDDFDKADWNSKWGVHDHVLMDRFLKDINESKKKPFFKTVFTLTSHEPFEFPGEYKFGKDGEENKFRSAHAYTDKAIGKFIEDAKKQDWWDSTLVIIMADHGHPFPLQKGEFNAPSRFHIPMLWLGGALIPTDTTISNYSSQSDFSFSLLSLLGGDNADFVFGKNIFDQSNGHYSHYIFNRGFGILNNNDLCVYDYVSSKSILTKGENSETLEVLGKALTQTAYQDFLERK